MNFDEYQAKCLRTANVNKEIRDKLTMAALGLTGEAGEVADEIKKTLFQSHELNKEKLANEAGDVLWYLAYLANTLGMGLGDIAARNIAKLEKRYPNGFEASKSLNRET